MTADAQRRSSWLRLAVFASVLAAYANALSGPFQFDDHGVIVREPSVQALAAFGSAAAASLRPLLKLSYALCWSVSPAPLVFHVFNLVVHLLNVALVIRVYSAAAAPQQRWPFAVPAPGAFAAALLFGLHPIQSEAVTYISGRSASLATSFALLALLFHAAGARSSQRLFYAAMTAAAFVAAALTKETLVVLPLGFLLWDLFVEKQRPRRALLRFLPWAAASLSLLSVAIMQERYFNLLYRALGQRSFADSLRFQLAGLAYLGERLLLLKPLCIDPALQLQPPATSTVLFSGALMLACCGLALWLSPRRPLLAFGVFWFVLYTFVPYLLVPRADVINERHAYVANAGLFMGVASLLSALRERFRGSRPAALGLVAALVLGIFTARRNRDYRSELALWQSTVRAAPHNPRALNNLGVALESEQRYAEARNAYARALLVEPRYTKARKNLERAMRRQLDVRRK